MGNRIFLRNFLDSRCRRWTSHSLDFTEMYVKSLINKNLWVDIESDYTRHPGDRQWSGWMGFLIGGNYGRCI